MQNRYAGDIGDFGKFGLLRKIAAAGLSAGINWYLTDDEKHNEDGKHVGYFDNPDFNGCDDALRDALKTVVENERSVAALEKLELVKNAVYYSEKTPAPRSERVSRHEWHKEAMRRLCGCDVVFLDPDNAILPKSVSPNSAKSVKYVLHDEIRDYYADGRSVIVYNHRCREKEAKYILRFAWMREALNVLPDHMLGLNFKRGSLRDYIFAVQPRHSVRVRRALDAIAGGPWSAHFRLLALT